MHIEEMNRESYDGGANQGVSPFYIKSFFGNLSAPALAVTSGVGFRIRPEPFENQSARALAATSGVGFRIRPKKFIRKFILWS
ncbi:hypothetical protein KSX_25430 [Ktedonospora formicarum]|uniref:Uncharacterized protein n=1 Tax=Ktedonospora formicarum TaxID=2778364 RepID=A0A8J3MQW2_9CHLR|nr:hypothetical protein KSX_25430 [Ktedonospora formicarum]